MKRLLLALAILCLAVPAFAGVPGKTELTFSGSYVNSKESAAVWQVGADILFPLGTGIVVLGPSVAVNSDDNQTGAGAVLEFNVPGQSGGFFFGGQALYYLDSLEGQDDHSATGRAGIKLPMGKSSLLKIYVEEGLTGRARDTDLTGALALVCKF